MKTRRQKIVQHCNCSPDVGDCPRCIRGIVKTKAIQRRRMTKRSFTKSRDSKPHREYKSQAGLSR